MLIEILLCAEGLVVLSVAADHLVQGSSWLAIGLRINPVVVGIVIIGLGTSVPEFLVSASAAARGDAGIAVGNIVGSNIQQRGKAADGPFPDRPGSRRSAPIARASTNR